MRYHVVAFSVYLSSLLSSKPPSSPVSSYVLLFCAQFLLPLDIDLSLSNLRIVKLDASIMVGNTTACGGVMGVTTIKNPISLGKLVLDICFFG